MNLKSGFGTLYITEAANIKDVLNTASYGDDAILQFTVDLLRSIGGLDLPEDDYQARGIISQRKYPRIQSSYCVFYSDEDYTLQNVESVYQRNLWDAACDYRTYASQVAEALEKARDAFESTISIYRSQTFTTPDGVPDYTLAEVNALIAERTDYGVRHEVARGEGYVVFWSNGSARWSVEPNKRFIGQKFRLDANQIFVVGELESIRSMCMDMVSLPLYELSNEVQYGA